MTKKTAETKEAKKGKKTIIFSGGQTNKYQKPAEKKVKE